MRHSIFCALALLCAHASPSAALPVHYNVIDLGRAEGVLAGESQTAVDISDTGLISGTAPFGTPGIAYEAYSYDDGVKTSLGTLGGWNSHAKGINNSGQVAGVSIVGDSTDRAFLYTGGIMQDLGTLGGNRSFAHDVNNLGQVTGSASPPTGNSHAFVYKDGTMHDLGVLSLGNVSTGYAINDSGQVAGVSGPFTATQSVSSN